MKTLALVLFLAAQITANAQFMLRNEERIVFLGDSTTANAQYPIYVEAFLRTRFPANNYQIINEARSEERVGTFEDLAPFRNLPQIQSRFVEDIASLNPTMLVLNYGMDDGFYSPFAQAYFDRFVIGYLQLSDLVRNSTRSRTTVMTPPNFTPVGMVPANDLRPIETYSATRPFAYYNNVLGILSQHLVETYSNNAIVVDTRSRMLQHTAARRQSTPGFRLQDGAILPSPTGNMVMALSLLERWQFPAFVENVQLDGRNLTSKSPAVSEIKKDGDAIIFNWKTILPVPVDPAWDSGSVKLENLDSRYYKLFLRARFLPPGNYEISINKFPYMKATDRVLDKGIDLTSQSDFPLRNKSLEVLELIRRQHGLGNEIWQQPTSPKKADWAELDSKIKTLTQPADLEISIAPVKEDSSRQ